MEEYTTWLFLLVRQFAKFFGLSSSSDDNKRFGKSRSRSETQIKILWGGIEIKTKTSKEQEWDNRPNKE